MLDVYEFGEVERISPEAPVPVVRLRKREIRPGGAANVACNLRNLGAKVSLFSVVGQDNSAAQLTQLLHQQGIDNRYLITSPSRPTTTKTRILSGGKQVIRLDLEEDTPISESDEHRLAMLVQAQLSSLDVLIFQDYDKGVLNKAIIQTLIADCRKQGVITAVDPKFRNFHNYQGADFFKPNLKETKEALRIQALSASLPDLNEVAQSLFLQQSFTQVMITLSEHGVFYASDKDQGIWPAHLRSIADVSGAGDTVIAVAALCLGSKLPIALTAALSNLAGGLACESIGAVSVSPNQLAKEASIRLTSDFQLENIKQSE